MHKKLTAALLMVALLAIVTGCSGNRAPSASLPSTAEASGNALSAMPEAAAAPISSAPAVLSMSAALDPDLALHDDPDPYARCPRGVIDAFRPDHELFNELYHAVQAQETAIDLSDSKLSYMEKARTVDAIYALSNYQFFFLEKVNLSTDGKAASIYYRQTPEQIRADTNAYYGRMSFILNNIALAEYSPLQKLFAIYQNIAANSVYTDDMSDVTQISAFSVLVRGEGICHGYATLGALLFSGAGIPCRYVTNEAHAWNIVTIGGQNYCTDLTWGAGISSTNKCIAYALMDDTFRQQSLQVNGFAGSQTYVDYIYGPEAVPRCQDSRYGALNALVFEPYALDIPVGWIYYYEQGAIRRMRLDGSAKEDVLPLMPAYLAFFDGRLYYVDSETANLHSYRPGDPAPIEIDVPPVSFMELSGSKLSCVFNDPAVPDKSLSLIPFQPSDYETAQTVSMPDAVIPAGRSLSLDVHFSAPMAEQIGEDSLRLVDEGGSALPLQAQWSADRQTLSLRPQAYWGDTGSLVLYVKDLHGEEGGTLAGVARLKMTLEP